MQTLPFPTALRSQLQLGKEEIVGAEKSLQSVRNDLVFEVKGVYFQLLYLESFHKLLNSQDSLYSDFAKASAFRFASGETNLLEKATAETQWMEVKKPAAPNEADIRIAQTRLQALMKVKRPFRRLTF